MAPMSTQRRLVGSSGPVSCRSAARLRARLGFSLRGAGRCRSQPWRGVPTSTRPAAAPGIGDAVLIQSRGASCPAVGPGRHPGSATKHSERLAVPVNDPVQQCTRLLRERLRSGALRPGDQIKQEALASELGVSRTPLRQALQGLAGEGLLENIKGRGFFVQQMSLAELRQIFLLRGLLEDQLYESLVVSQTSLARTLSLRDQLEAAYERVDLPAMTRLNREFHFSIFEMSPLSLVCDFVDQLWSLSDGYRSMYMLDSAARTRVTREHRELIDALKNNDVEKIKAVAAQHRDGAIQNLGLILGNSSG